MISRIAGAPTGSGIAAIGRLLLPSAWFGLGAVAATDLVVDEVLLTGVTEGADVVLLSGDDVSA